MAVPPHMMNRPRVRERACGAEDASDYGKNTPARAVKRSPNGSRPLVPRKRPARVRKRGTEHDFDEAPDGNTPACGEEVIAQAPEVISTDLVCDRTLALTRLSVVLLEYFPALEAAFDYAMVKAAVVLLTKYTTPAGIRRAGEARITTWLRNQGCYNAKTIAAKAVAAAQAQRTTIQAQEVGAEIVAALARTVLDLHEEVNKLDQQIESRFREHRHAEILLSMPGFGTLLGAELLAATGRDITAYDTAARLAGVAGLARSPATPDASAATTTAPNATIAGSSIPSTSQPNPPHDTAPKAAPTTNANAPRAKTTNKRSCPWPDGASTSSGPCCVTTPPTNNPPPEPSKRQPKLGAGRKLHVTGLHTPERRTRGHFPHTSGRRHPPDRLHKTTTSPSPTHVTPGMRWPAPWA